MTIADDQRRREEQAEAANRFRREIARDFFDWQRRPATDNPTADRELRERAERESRRIGNLP